MRFLLSFLVSFGFISGSFAQDKQLFKSYFLSAEEFFFLEDFDEAIFYYSELLKLDPGNYNINFLLGACYLSRQDDKALAIPYFEMAVQGISAGYRDGSYKERYAPREALFALARAYHVANELDMAVNYYERYRSAMLKNSFAEIEYVNKQIASCRTAGHMIRTPVNVTFTPVGDKVDQPSGTYNAVISGTGNRLIYMTDKIFYRAIMMTERQGDGWTSPRVINPEVWSDGYSFPTSLSFDGNEMYLVTKKGVDADIYVSHYRNGKWSQMIRLNETINTEYYESHASISPDGKVLYFTSDRPGGQGGLDIYISKRDIDDEWGPAKNIGPKINSHYSENTPFMAADNKTLFFSSQGHTTMGGYDIFSSDRLPDASWSIPGNIGYPVNTCDDDLFYVPRKNKNQALYAMVLKDRDPRRMIYSLNTGVPEGEVQIAIRADEEQPGDDLAIQDVPAASDSALTASVQEGSSFSTDSGGIIQQSIVTETVTGTGYDSAFLATGQSGNMAGSGTVIQAAGQGSTMTEQEHAALTSDPAKEYYILNSIFFDYDSYILNDSATREAERILEVMKKYPELRLEVIGHTDARGTADYNLQLSGKRAQAVADYLVNHGIDPGRLESRGVGEAAPVAIDNFKDGADSPEGRTLNRHVDLRLHNLNHPNIEVADVFVPDHLRPRNDYSYSVLLVQSDIFLDTLPAVVGGENVYMINAGNQYFYTAGNYNNRIDAVNLLNYAIDSGFPEAQMMEKRQLEELVTSLIEGEVPPVITFTIQIMALRKPVPVSYFTNLKPVSKFEGADGLTRYVYGEFREIDIAFEEMNAVRRKGYHDAFIRYLARYQKSNN